MQPQLLTIIIIIVILYVIQNTSNRIIVKEKFTLTPSNIFGHITQEELDEVNKLCKQGIDPYIQLRGRAVEHSLALKHAQWICFMS
jgi:hypothetical protein